MPRAVLAEEQFEELDEVRQADYKKGQDGSYILDLEGVDDHPHVKGLANTLKKYREVAPDAKAAMARLEEAERLKAEFEEIGVGDLEDVKASLARLKELEEDAGEGDKDLQAELARQREALEKQQAKLVGKKEEEIQALNQRIASLTAFLERTVIDRQLDDALAHVKVIESLRPGASALIRSKYRPNVTQEVDEEGNIEFKGIVKTDLGEASIPDFVEKWATEDEAAPYLPASGNAGTGSRTSDGGGVGRTNPWKPESFNLTKQGEIANKNPALAKQLKEAAGV